MRTTATKRRNDEATQGEEGTKARRHGGTKGNEIATKRRSNEATKGSDQGSEASRQRGNKTFPSRRREPAVQRVDAANVAALRERQRSVAGFLEAAFGPLASTDQSLWDRRAYLLLVGMIYERLALHEDDLPTDELVALSKALAENRRAENQSRDSRAEPDQGESRDSATLETSVRDLYGIALPQTDEASTQEVNALAQSTRKTPLCPPLVRGEATANNGQTVSACELR